jgi:DUF1009 family protein
MADSNSRIAIIAGAGRFPFHVAREAKRQGSTVVALGIQGWVDTALRGEVDRYEEIAVGQLGRMIRLLKEAGTARAIMAGKVTKAVLLDRRTAFDEEALRVLSGVRDVSVGAVLGAIGRRLAEEGITLLDSSTYLQADLCPDAVLTRRGPTAAEQEDIWAGLSAARAIAALDIGQTVIVKGKVIVAVEALEGTDAAIRRAHQLSGDGLVVVKTASPSQDRRFDLPVIGPETVATLCEAGVSCLALEAGSTLLLDRPLVIERANTAGICVLGVPPPA